MTKPQHKTEIFEQHAEDIRKATEEIDFVVFLCGPSIKDYIKDPDPSKHDPAVVLRAKIKEDLEANGFDVVLGEDDGLEEPRLKIRRNAQDNELQFISKYCNAVIIVTASTAIGAFCELGLFSWHFSHPKGLLKHKKSEKDFILLVEKEYEGQRSYFNEGPAKAVNAFGRTLYIDYRTHNVDWIIDRFQDRKPITPKDRRGRPRKNP